jgi:hypothetical protein
LANASPADWRQAALATLNFTMKTPRNRKILTPLKPPLFFGGLFLALTTLAPAQQPDTATLAQTPDSGRIEGRVENLLKQLTLEEKVKYLVGNPPADPTLPNSTSQDIPPVPRLGLPELRNFDGPAGVRPGTAPSTRFPANLLLAAAWWWPRCAPRKLKGSWPRPNTS